MSHYSMSDHFPRKLTVKSTESSNKLPDEIIIDNKNVTKSHKIACKLNEYFTSISKRLNTCNTDNTLIAGDLLNIYEFIEDKVPENVRFHHGNFSV